MSRTCSWPTRSSNLPWRLRRRSLRSALGERLEPVGDDLDGASSGVIGGLPLTALEPTFDVDESAFAEVASVSTFGSRPVRAAFLECSAAALAFIETANAEATAPDARRAAVERMQSSMSLLADLMNNELHP